MKGGKITDSGHRIGLTDSQMTDFGDLRAQAVNNIVTEPGLSATQKAQDIKNLPSMQDAGFYTFLKQRFRTGMDVHNNIYENLSEQRKKKLKRQDMTPKSSKKKA